MRFNAFADVCLQLLEDDSDRKAAFENELGGIQIALQRVTVHAHVPKRFPQVKEDLQVRALDVLSAVLDLIGRQLSHLKKFRASIPHDLFANRFQYAWLRLF